MLSLSAQIMYPSRPGVMGVMDSAELTVDKLEADCSYAQILIGIGGSSARFDEVRRLIESNGIRILSVRHFNSGEVLVKLDTADMREIVLCLIEAGFSWIKGINAGPLTKERKH